MSIVENTIAAAYDQAPFSHAGRLDMGAARAEAVRLIGTFGVAAASPESAIGSLSGGNMQKVVLGRAIAARPKLLVACQPTRGVDIGAMQSIREHLIALRDQGAAVLLISADLDEILALSDRIAVLAHGRLAAHFAADTVSADDLGAYMTGMRHAALAQATLDSPFTPKLDAGDS
jgi:simple sugar transport system ATP-binding protein